MGTRNSFIAHTIGLERQVPTIRQSARSESFLYANRYIASTAVGAIVFAPMAWHVVLDPVPGSDFSMHLGLATRMWQEGAIGLPHFLYHFLILLMSNCMGMTLKLASLLLTTAGLAAILPLSQLVIFRERGGLSALSIVLVTSIASSITIWTIPSHHLYFGYIPLAVYHSPTMTLMKPLALWNFLLLSRGLTVRISSARVQRWSVISLILCGLAKPSYVLILLPAAIVFVCIRKLLRAEASWWFLLHCVVVPSLALLIWQYCFTYLSNSAFYCERGETGIEFAPLLAVRTVSGNLLIKLLGSIAFPLSVSCVHWNRLRAYPEYNFALLLFSFGALCFYLLAERGMHLTHLNFLWSASIGLLLWFLCCVRILVVETRNSEREMGSMGTLICCFVLALHIICGALWYAVEVTRSFAAGW